MCYPPARVCADVLHPSQHMCVLMCYPPARVCADALHPFQHVCVLMCYPPARVCADVLHPSQHVCVLMYYPPARVWSGILPLPRMISLRPGCVVRTICGQLVTSCLHLGRFFFLPPYPALPSSHPPPRNTGLKLMHIFEKIV